MYVNNVNPSTLSIRQAVVIGSARGPGRTGRNFLATKTKAEGLDYPKSPKPGIKSIYFERY